jgi:hypothetical protein
MRGVLVQSAAARHRPTDDTSPWRERWFRTKLWRYALRRNPSHAQQTAGAEKPAESLIDRCLIAWFTRFGRSPSLACSLTQRGMG